MTAALAVVVAVPIAVVVSLGRTMTAPFWFDEQWRASFISYDGGWLQGLRADHMASIATGWFLVERWTGEVFGSTELSLRTPIVVFFVLNCVLLLLLARRWMPLWAALAVALVGGLTPDIVQYAVQLKPYVVDSATVIAVLLLHDIARHQEPSLSGRRVTLWCYLGIGTACFFGTATVLVAGPLLLVDALQALRSLRSKLLYRRILEIAVAGVPALVNVALQARENPSSEYSYWGPWFPPRHGIAAQVTFVWDGLRSFVSVGLSDGYALAAPLHAALITVWTVLLVSGVVTIVRKRVATSLLVGLVGSFVLILAASFLRIWPFGYVRTNIFEVPLLVLLAGVGAFGAPGELALLGNSLHRRPAGRPAAAAGRWAVASVVLVGALGVGIAAAYEFGGYRSLARHQPPPRYGDEVRRAVAIVRQEATHNAAVMMVGNMAVDGWRYYLFEYTGDAVRTGPAIPRGHVLFELRHGARSETAFLAKLRPSEVFVYVRSGTTGAELGQDLARVSAAGYCRQTASRAFATSGLLVTITASSACLST